MLGVPVDHVAEAAAGLDEVVLVVEDHRGLVRDVDLVGVLGEELVVRVTGGDELGLEGRDGLLFEFLGSALLELLRLLDHALLLGLLDLAAFFQLGLLNEAALDLDQLVVGEDRVERRALAVLLVGRFLRLGPGGDLEGHHAVVLLGRGLPLFERPEDLGVEELQVERLVRDELLVLGGGERVDVLLVDVARELVGLDLLRLLRFLVVLGDRLAHRLFGDVEAVAQHFLLRLVRLPPHAARAVELGELLDLAFHVLALAQAFVRFDDRLLPVGRGLSHGVVVEHVAERLDRVVVVTGVLECIGELLDQLELLLLARVRLEIGHRVVSPVELHEHAN